MIIDVSDILEQPGAFKHFEGSEILNDFIYQGDLIRFPYPFSIKGVVTNNGECLSANIFSAGDIMMPCSRCAKEFTRNVDISVDVKLKRNVDEEDPDTFLYENNEIVLNDILLEYILLQIPVKKLCKVDCKGLCPFCGKDLNEGKCKCKGQEDIDVRLTPLKDFFLPHDKEV